ncbi:MAG: iron complex transport system substrate-binding protein [Chloroflexota bacterium]|nr:iron complex transport system substrate-binding protein [Chloroflexota bacterium]
MRIVSLLPSATEIVYALGLGDELVGRTHECDYPPEVESVPTMTSDVGGSPLDDSRQIHDRVGQALHGGSSIYRLDTQALAAAKPDLILTQELCDVCAVSYREVTEAVRAIEGDITVVSLEPSSIEGIFNTISTVGAMAEAEDEAVGLLELLRERLGAIENRALERRLAGIPPRRVVCLEWLDPPFAAGHWVPEQVRRAGGWDLLGQGGERSVETSWDAVRDVDPEQLMLMPCGFDAARTAREYERMDKPEWFDELRAVRRGELFALDGSGYFSRPGPRVVDGIGLLAELMDPEGFVDVAPPHAWIPIGPAYSR